MNAHQRRVADRAMLNRKGMMAPLSEQEAINLVQARVTRTPGRTFVIDGTGISAAAAIHQFEPRPYQRDTIARLVEQGERYTGKLIDHMAQCQNVRGKSLMQGVTEILDQLPKED